MVLIKFIKEWKYRSTIWAITHGIWSIHWQEAPVIEKIMISRITCHQRTLIRILMHRIISLYIVSCRVRIFCLVLYLIVYCCILGVIHNSEYRGGLQLWKSKNFPENFRLLCHQILDLFLNEVWKFFDNNKEVKDCWTNPGTKNYKWLAL